MADSQTVTYRSLAGELLEAKVIDDSARTVSIDIHLPGCSEPLRLSKIPIYDADMGKPGTCFSHAD